MKTIINRISFSRSQQIIAISIFIFFYGCTSKYSTQNAKGKREEGFSLGPENLITGPDSNVHSVNTASNTEDIIKFIENLGKLPTFYKRLDRKMELSIENILKKNNREELEIELKEYFETFLYLRNFKESNFEGMISNSCEGKLENFFVCVRLNILEENLKYKKFEERLEQFRFLHSSIGWERTYSKDANNYGLPINMESFLKNLQITHDELSTIPQFKPKRILSIEDLKNYIKIDKFSEAHWSIFKQAHNSSILNDLFKIHKWFFKSNTFFSEFWDLVDEWEKRELGKISNQNLSNKKIQVLKEAIQKERQDVISNYLKIVSISNIDAILKKEPNLIKNIIENSLEKILEKESTNSKLKKLNIALNVFFNSSKLICFLGHLGRVDSGEGGLVDVFAKEISKVFRKNITKDLYYYDQLLKILTRLFSELSEDDYNKFVEKLKSQKRDLCLCAELAILKDILNQESSESFKDRINNFCSIIEEKMKKCKNPSQDSLAEILAGDDLKWIKLSQYLSEYKNFEELLFKKEEPQILKEEPKILENKPEVEVQQIIPKARRNKKKTPQNNFIEKTLIEEKKELTVNQQKAIEKLLEFASRREKKMLMDFFAMIYKFAENKEIFKPAVQIIEETNVDWSEYVLNYNEKRKIFRHILPKDFRLNLKKEDINIYEKLSKEQENYICKNGSKLENPTYCEHLLKNMNVFFTPRSGFVFQYISGLVLDFDRSDDFFKDFDDKKIQEYIESFNLPYAMALMKTRNGWHLHILEKLSYWNCIWLMIKMKCDPAYIGAYIHNAEICGHCNELLKEGETYFSLRLSPKIHPKKESGEGVDKNSFLNPLFIYKDNVFELSKTYNFDKNIEQLLKETDLEKILSMTKEFLSKNAINPSDKINFVNFSSKNPYYDLVMSNYFKFACLNILKSYINHLKLIYGSNILDENVNFQFYTDQTVFGNHIREYLQKCLQDLLFVPQKILGMPPENFKPTKVIKRKKEPIMEKEKSIKEKEEPKNKAKKEFEK